MDFSAYCTGGIAATEGRICLELAQRKIPFSLFSIEH